MPRYELDGDLWQIVQHGKELEITAAGKTTVRKFVTPEQATAQLDKLVEARLAVGWRLAVDDTRHLDLEATIAREPETAEHYAVLGDWLESQGDPRGRYIALQLAAEAKDAPPSVATAAAKYFKQHADYLLGPLAGHARPDELEPTFTWRFGFIHQAYLHGTHHAPIDRVLDQLLRAPSGRFLVHLALVRKGRIQEAVDVLARLAPPSLRALRLWGVEDIDLAALWPAVPELRRLSLTGRALALGDLALPRLERLELTDEQMPHATTRHLARNPWPALQHLRLDFGRGQLTGDASIDDVFALLARRDLGALAQLAIVHTRYIAELVRELAASPLAGQLRTLDLSNNLMDDRHALELAKHRAGFRELASLDVSYNQLTPKGVDALRALGLAVRCAG